MEFQTLKITTTENILAWKEPYIIRRPFYPFISLPCLSFFPFFFLSPLFFLFLMNTKAVYPRKLQKSSLITHLSSMTDYMAFSFTQSGKFLLSVLCWFITWCNWYLVMRAFEHHPSFKRIEVNKFLCLKYTLKFVPSS